MKEEIYSQTQIDENLDKKQRKCPLNYMNVIKGIFFIKRQRISNAKEI